LQGYGLTETSGVLCYNRGDRNRAGTVGTPIPGVELTLAEDGEVLVKAPFVTAGYYRDLAATQAAIDAEGWFHTGDLGQWSDDSFLTLTGVKKDRFKLSTGKYVSPLPLEQVVETSPLVRHAIAVGAGQKFCAMVIVPNWVTLRAGAEEWGLETTGLNWPRHPRLLNLYQQLIDRANCHLPYWSTVRQFCLADGDLTVENGGLYPDGRLNRAPHGNSLSGKLPSYISPRKPSLSR
jgi:long-chain acyl-CoA synthetase